jgi:hypothetical protein
MDQTAFAWHVQRAEDALKRLKDAVSDLYLDSPLLDYVESQAEQLGFQAAQIARLVANELGKGPTLPAGTGRGAPERRPRPPDIGGRGV